MCGAALSYRCRHRAWTALPEKRCGGSSWTGRPHFACSAVGHAPAVAPVRYPQYPSGVVSASTEGYATAPRAVPRKPARTIVSICFGKRWALLCKSVRTARRLDNGQPLVGSASGCYLRADSPVAPVVRQQVGQHKNSQEHMGAAQEHMRTTLRRFRERGEIPEAVGYGLPTALILLALLWPFLYGVVPSRAVWKSTSASGAP